MNDPLATAEAKTAIANMRRWREQPSTFVREVFQVQPDAWQVDVLDAFPTHPRQAMKAPLEVDQIVPTPAGARAWGTVQVGEQLFAADGSLTLVRRRIDVGRVPLFRVSFRDGTSLRVSGDHEWRVQTQFDRRHARGWRTISTDELRKMRLRSTQGQRLVCVPSQGAAQFPHRDLPADPYVFGLWLGDGNAGSPRLTCPDHAIRHEIVARGQPITESTRTPKRIGLVGFARPLAATGMMACRSYEKRIPETYRFASAAQRLDLLRGLMDSDGTCAKNGHTYLASCSEPMIDDFMWLARSLGYVATKLGPYIINGGVNRDSFRAVICGPVCPFLADTSKRRRWRTPSPGKYARFIESVERDGFGAAMCVEVDHPSHCFQATDFIVTHNCKGPGKTGVLAWLNWNFLSTRTHPKMAAVSINADNLADNLWAEMAKWRGRSQWLMAKFEWTKTRIFAREAPETWFLSARTWSKSADAQQQSNTLAGLHADNIMFTLDEAGGIPDAVMATAEGALSSCIEGHIVMAGNPTHTEGPLWRACTVEKKLWHITEITGDPDDPKRSPRISVDWARTQIEKYGRESAWVLVNVFGKFPRSSLNALIGPDDIAAAMQRFYREHELRGNARILGVDVAKQGDDSSVICQRQGRQVFPFKQYRDLNSIEGAAATNQIWTAWDADACFVDNTGGFGSGWIDQLRILGKSPIPVEYAGKPMDARYFNKRAEMYFLACAWIKEGGALPPDCAEVGAALTKTTYTFQGDKLILEPKDEIKAKLGYSPDHADAFVQTFHSPVTAKERYNLPGQKPRHSYEYDPFRELNAAR